MTEDFLDTPPDPPPHPWSTWFHPLTIAAFLLRPRVRYVLSWILAVVVAGFAVYDAWTCWDEPPPATSQALRVAEVCSVVAAKAQCGQALGCGPVPYLLGVADPVVRARRDRNWGHATIDFGGQYLMGRMIVEGRGRELYRRAVHREVLEQAFPNPAPTSAEVESSDTDKLLGWMMSSDKPEFKTTWFELTDKSIESLRAAEVPQGVLSKLNPLKHRRFALREDFVAELGNVLDNDELARFQDRVANQAREELGGPMYPPVHAVLYAPLCLLSPPSSYRLAQLLVLVTLWLCGWLVERLSDGRVWWPVAVVALIVYPGFTGAIDLGQNATFTLLILLAGWWQLKEGHPWRGGLLWGFLAYKPVWAAAFLLAPLLLRRWRFVAAVVLGGAALAAATLPLVGVQTWFDWWKVGQIGAWEYTRQQTWILLGRELLNIPRRWMLEFANGLGTQESLEGRLPTILGMLLWLTPPALTVLLVWLRRRCFREVTGPGAALVLLGAYFACYHFMYYDAMLAVLPLALLFAEPWRFLPLYRWHGPIPPTADPAVAAPGPLLVVLVRGPWAMAFALRRRWWRDLPAVVLLVLLLASANLFSLWKTEGPSPPPWGSRFGIAFVVGLLMLMISPAVFLLGRTQLFHPFRTFLFNLLFTLYCVVALSLLLGTLVVFALRRQELFPPPWDTLLTLGLWLWCAWEVALSAQPPPAPRMPLEESVPVEAASETAVCQLD
jgi:hypothetical protein